MREFIDAAVFRDIILCASAALEQNRQLINELNVFPVPDGDTGTNMGLTMGAAASELGKKSFTSLSAAADCAAWPSGSRAPKRQTPSSSPPPCRTAWTPPTRPS